MDLHELRKSTGSIVAIAKRVEKSHFFLAKRAFSCLDEAVAMDAAPHAIFYPLLGCNARCPFCSSRVYTEEGIVATSDWLAKTTSRGLGEHTLSLEEAQGRYRTLRDEGVTRVSLQGGEPTIWPHLLDLIAYGKTIGLSEQIVVTNGIRLADPAYAKSLYQSGATTIALSVFGASATTHDASMGVSGAFDALVLGAKNLASLGPDGAHVTAQFILHAHNYRELGAMIEFWHARGIRSFGLRLLREVPNVAGEGGKTWFFDLAALGPELSRALNIAVGLPGVSLAFPEILYCLLEPQDIGFVLADLAAGRRLSSASKVIGKRREQSRELRRALPMVGSESACQACELESACAKIESPYTQLFSGTLRPIHLREDVQAAIDEANTGKRRPGIEALLRVDPDELEALGIDLDALSSIRGAVDVEVRRGLSALVKEKLEPDTVVRFLSFSALGARTRLWGAPDKILAELILMANPSGREKLHFIAQRATCIQVTPFWLVFSGCMPISGGRRDAAFWAIVHDDLRAPEAEIEALIRGTGA